MCKNARTRRVNMRVRFSSCARATMPRSNLILKTSSEIYWIKLVWDFCDEVDIIVRMSMSHDHRPEIWTPMLPNQYGGGSHILGYTKSAVALKLFLQSLIPNRIFLFVLSTNTPWLKRRCFNPNLTLINIHNNEFVIFSCSSNSITTAVCLSVCL